MPTPFPRRPTGAYGAELPETARGQVDVPPEGAEQRRLGHSLETFAITSGEPMPNATMVRRVPATNLTAALFITGAPADGRYRGNQSPSVRYRVPLAAFQVQGVPPDFRTGGPVA